MFGFCKFGHQILGSISEEFMSSTKCELLMAFLNEDANNVDYETCLKIQTTLPQCSLCWPVCTVYVCAVVTFTYDCAIILKTSDYLSSFCYVCHDCGSWVVASNIPDKKSALPDIIPRNIASTREGLKNSLDLPQLNAHHQEENLNTSTLFISFINFTILLLFVNAIGFLQSSTFGLGCRVAL